MVVILCYPGHRLRSLRRRRILRDVRALGPMPELVQKRQAPSGPGVPIPQHQTLHDHVPRDPNVRQRLLRVFLLRVQLRGPRRPRRRVRAHRGAGTGRDHRVGWEHLAPPRRRQAAQKMVQRHRFRPRCSPVSRHQSRPRPKEYLR